MTHARPRGPFTTAFFPTFRGWGGKNTASRPQPRRGSRVAAAHLHCPMISSKACRCSRSRRRSSAAMCRFHGGKPAARSPDAISAARREGAAGASAHPAREGRPRGEGGGQGGGGGRCPARGGASAAARNALSESGLGTQPPPHARHGAAAALCQGPSPLSGAPQWRQRLPRRCLTPPSRPPPPPLATPPSPPSTRQHRGEVALQAQYRLPPPGGRAPFWGEGASRRAILWPPPGSASARCRHFESGEPHHPARAAILRGLYPPLQRRMRVSPVAPLGGGGGGACHDRFSRYRGVSPTPGCLRGPRHPLCRPK